MKKIKDVASILGVHPNTIRRWIKSGKLKATKVGRDWKISEEVIDKTKEQGLKI